MTRAREPKTVLVVEHDPWLRTEVSDLLVGQGYNVVAASNGLSGLRLAAQHEPDLILLDVKVPEVSSGEVVRELRSRERTQHIPVIAMANERPLSPAGQPVDPDALVLKPLDRASFVARVADSVLHHLPEQHPAPAPSVARTRPAHVPWEAELRHGRARPFRAPRDFRPSGTPDPERSARGLLGAA